MLLAFFVGGGGVSVAFQIKWVREGGVEGGGSVAFQMRWVCWMFFHGG